MELNGNKIKQKLSKKYECIFCDYCTDRKSNFDSHFNSAKHKNNANGNNGTKIKQILSNNFSCEICSRSYKTKAGLWKHKKTCESNINDAPNSDLNKDDLILQLLKQNQDLQKSLIELSKDKSITNNNNSHNKTFNMQFFLNETCKDALNIKDFINSIQLQVKDLDNTAKEGYVSGISNIIIKELKDLDVNKRPIHCSDLKRETLYIKDNNTWEKENEDKQKIKQAIKEISDKNIKQIPLWLKEHPNFSKYNHPDNDEYMSLLTCCMSGSTKEEQEDNLNKIIKKLSKEVVIEK